MNAIKSLKMIKRIISLFHKNQIYYINVKHRSNNSKFESDENLNNNNKVYKNINEYQNKVKVNQNFNNNPNKQDKQENDNSEKQMNSENENDKNENTKEYNLNNDNSKENLNLNNDKISNSSSSSYSNQTNNSNQSNQTNFNNQENKEKEKSNSKCYIIDRKFKFKNNVFVVVDNSSSFLDSLKYLFYFNKNPFKLNKLSYAILALLKNVFFFILTGYKIQFVLSLAFLNYEEYIDNSISKIEIHSSGRYIFLYTIDGVYTMPINTVKCNFDVKNNFLKIEKQNDIGHLFLDVRTNIYDIEIFKCILNGYEIHFSNFNSINELNSEKYLSVEENDSNADINDSKNKQSKKAKGNKHDENSNINNNNKNSSKYILNVKI